MESYFSRAATTIIYFTLGILYFVFLAICLLLSTPIYAYRLIVTKVIVPCFCRDISKPVSLGGQALATDFITSNLPYSHRSNVVLCITFLGDITFNEVNHVFQREWVQKKDITGKLIYPEFQRYVHQFMGFMFWKLDQNFELSNHIFQHDVGASTTDESSDGFLCNLMETLMNKPFPEMKSPWELHLVNNYRNSCLSPGSMSVLIFRFHHCLGDGASILKVLGEATFGKPINSFSSNAEKQIQTNILSKIANISTYLPRLVYDLGYLATLHIRKITPSRVILDKGGSSQQIFVKTKLIPVKYVKEIKNKFGVEFTAVILSCVSAAINEYVSWHHGMSTCGRGTTPIIMPIPKFTQKTKFGIHSTAVLFNLHVGRDLHPEKRFLMCQKLLTCAKQSTIPTLYALFCQLLQSNISSVSRSFLKSMYCPAYLTILKMPNGSGYWNGNNELLGMDYTCGLLFGNVELGFVVPSCKEYMRFVISSDSAVMGKDQLNVLKHVIESELEMLFSANTGISEYV